MLSSTSIRKKVFLIFMSSWMFSQVHAQSWKLTPENISSALKRQSEKVMKDSLRPGYHLTPPAGCMGDPNGGIYYEGYYHIFYGLQPFSSSFGGWYWAHAKSKDLLQWEHSKPGLTPAFELGLSNIGSGSTIVSKEGTPLAFYSVSKDGSMKFWRAEFNDDLSEWSHKGKNPVLTLEHPGLPDFDEFWRDPFVFNVEGRTFLIACADLLDKNYVSVPIFEAKDAELKEWEYKGTLFTYPKHKSRNFEVPELRPLEDRWVFLASTDAPIDRTLYFVGDFDTETLTFTPESEGYLDYSGHYYAQETILDENGDLYLMAWIPGWDRDWMPNFREDDFKNSSELWNGCFAIPRKLSIDADGNLIQQPVNSLKSLHTEKYHLGPRKLTVSSALASFDVLKEVRGDQLELNLELELDAASFCGLNVLCDRDGKGGLFIMWSGDVINIGGVKVPVKEWKQGDSLQLQIFIDKQLVEVFVNGGRYCISQKVKSDYIKGDHVALTSLGGHAKLNWLEAWQLKTINNME